MPRKPVCRLQDPETDVRSSIIKAATTTSRRTPRRRDDKRQIRENKVPRNNLRPDDLSCRRRTLPHAKAPASPVAQGIQDSRAAHQERKSKEQHRAHRRHHRRLPVRDQHQSDCQLRCRQPSRNCRDRPRRSTCQRADRLGALRQRRARLSHGGCDPHQPEACLQRVQ
jgi:hypothetical protein